MRLIDADKLLTRLCLRRDELIKAKDNTTLPLTKRASISCEIDGLNFAIHSINQMAQNGGQNA